MSHHGISESTVEDAAIDWFEALGYTVLQGPEIAPGEPSAERSDFGEVVLGNRLRAALERLNTNVPESARDEALRRVTRTETPSLVENNRRFHRLLTDGVDVEYRRADGSIAGDKVWLFDFAHPERNDWLAVNQFTVIENTHNRRADLAVFVNGIPLAVLELKNPGDESATVKGAFNQLQTYKKDIPALFHLNEVMVISDGLEARVGTITADWERFSPGGLLTGSTLPPRTLLNWKSCSKGSSRESDSSTWSVISSSSRWTGRPSGRSWPAITSTTPSTRLSPARSDPLRLKVTSA